MMRIKVEVDVPLGVVRKLLEFNPVDSSNGGNRTGVDVKKTWTQNRSLRNAKRERYRE
jgi:hypothetical protein